MPTRKTPLPASTVRHDADRSSLYVFLVVGMAAFLMLLLVFPLPRARFAVRVVLAHVFGNEVPDFQGDQEEAIQASHLRLIDLLEDQAEFEGLTLITNSSAEGLSDDLNDAMRVVRRFDDETNKNQVELQLVSTSRKPADEATSRILAAIENAHQSYADASAAWHLNRTQLEAEVKACEGSVEEAREARDRFRSEALQRHQENSSSDEQPGSADAPAAEPSVPLQTLSTVSGSATEERETPPEQEVELSDQLADLQRSLLHVLVHKMPEHPQVAEIEHRIKQLKLRIAESRYPTTPNPSPTPPVSGDMDLAPPASTDPLDFAGSPSNHADTDEVRIIREIEASDEMTEIRVAVATAEQQLSMAREALDHHEAERTDWSGTYSVLESHPAAPLSVLAATRGRLWKLLLVSVSIGLGFAVFRIREETSTTINRTSEIEGLSGISITAALSKPDGPPIRHTTIKRLPSWSRSAVAFSEIALVVLLFLVFSTAMFQEGFGGRLAANPFGAFVDAVQGAAAAARSWVPMN